MTIAGSLDGVDVCLNYGANPNQMAKNGMTAAKLAKGLGWKKVLSRLQTAGAEA
jgi:ankyrin repeat protein